MREDRLRVNPSMVEWAMAAAASLLAPLGNRWLHVQGVARRARKVAGGLGRDDAHWLIAAAYLHDVGWSPQLMDTGFHPIEGARWLRGLGHERLGRLVAYHSGAAFEAELRRLGPVFAEFEQEKSAVADALTYCDVTTDPVGEPAAASQRWAEIEQRYGVEDVVVAALERARPSLQEEILRTEERLKATGIQPM